MLPVLETDSATPQSSPMTRKNLISWSYKPFVRAHTDSDALAVSPVTFSQGRGCAEVRGIVPAWRGEGF